MATSWAPWLLQLFDDYGAVLAGGKVYSYEAGTSTPLATYQDRLGATPNANPTILDAAGRADIRLTNGVSYKIVILNSDDVELDSKDYLSVGEAASSSDATLLVNFTFEGTPGAQGFMGGMIFDRAATFPIDFEGSQASAQTSPTSDFVGSIRKNGVEVGTVTISSLGAATFTTTSGVAVSFDVGDEMTLRAPDSVYAIADVLVTIPGEIA